MMYGYRGLQGSVANMATIVWQVENIGYLITKHFYVFDFQMTKVVACATMPR